jgi:hypothetical protein
MNDLSAFVNGFVIEALQKIVAVFKYTHGQPGLAAVSAS